MKHLKHIYMMLLGYLLYLICFKLYDMRPDNLFFWWALPYIGYTGYRTKPHWWQIEGDR
jgi:hypothetical protein